MPERDVVVYEGGDVDAWWEIFMNCPEEEREELIKRVRAEQERMAQEAEWRALFFECPPALRGEFVANVQVLAAG